MIARRTTKGMALKWPSLHLKFLLMSTLIEKHFDSEWECIHDDRLYEKSLYVLLVSLR